MFCKLKEIHMMVFVIDKAKLCVRSHVAEQQTCEDIGSSCDPQTSFSYISDSHLKRWFVTGLKTNCDVEISFAAAVLSIASAARASHLDDNPRLLS